jgi:hypothetical protein
VSTSRTPIDSTYASRRRRATATTAPAIRCAVTNSSSRSVRTRSARSRSGRSSIDLRPPNSNWPPPSSRHTPPPRTCMRNTSYPYAYASESGGRHPPEPNGSLRAPKNGVEARSYRRERTVSRPGCSTRGKRCARSRASRSRVRTAGTSPLALAWTAGVSSSTWAAVGFKGLGSLEPALAGPPSPLPSGSSSRSSALDRA